jgi:hypothetical protein
VCSVMGTHEGVAYQDCKCAVSWVHMRVWHQCGLICIISLIFSNNFLLSFGGWGDHKGCQCMCMCFTAALASAV